ncbi:hypothetical protein A3710_11220 [Stutzerimonas frequens]|nr:hypothetical protein A3710_11220 [Stutzerimonas frequens]
MFLKLLQLCALLYGSFERACTIAVGCEAFCGDTTTAGCCECRLAKVLRLESAVGVFTARVVPYRISVFVFVYDGAFYSFYLSAACFMAGGYLDYIVGFLA